MKAKKIVTREKDTRQKSRSLSEGMCSDKATTHQTHTLPVTSCKRSRGESATNQQSNQCIIYLCTNYCYCINIGSDIGPPAVLYRYRYWLKHAISVADIVADPIIGTPLIVTEMNKSL